MPVRYLPRQTVNDRLRLAQRQSYRLFPAIDTAFPAVEYRDVVLMLNRAAVLEPLTDEVPFDLMTADELSAATGFPASRILRATRRTKAPLPHYHINHWCVRIRRSTFEKWFSRGGRNMSRKVAKNG